MLTWAFEFEGQPNFDGFRTLATNRVDNRFLICFGWTDSWRGNRLEATSNGAVALDSLLAKGVRKNVDVDVLATRDELGGSIMIWNYHDDDVAGPDVPIKLSVQDLPSGAQRVSGKHYRIWDHYRR